MTIAHGRSLLIAVLCWTHWALWLWPRAVQAGPLSADVRVYDWVSLGYACGLGFLGGGLALIVALASDRRVVTEVLAESLRNALVSPIAGGAAYLVMEASTALERTSPLPPVVRFLVIVGVGWAGIGAVTWMVGFAKARATAVAEWWLSRGKT